MCRSFSSFITPPESILVRHPTAVPSKTVYIALYIVYCPPEGCTTRVMEYSMKSPRTPSIYHRGLLCTAPPYGVMTRIQYDTPKITPVGAPVACARTQYPQVCRCTTAYYGDQQQGGGGGATSCERVAHRSVANNYLLTRQRLLLLLPVLQARSRV